MQKILVVGHSHITALRLAYGQAGGVPQMVFCGVTQPEFHPESCDGVLHPQIVARIEAVQATLHVSMLGGNDHTIMSLVNDPRCFDFVLPEAPDLALDPAAEWLPAGLLCAELARRCTPMVAALAAYRAAVRGRLVHIESPPPIPSAAFIAAHAEGFEAPIAARGVAPALLRYKMWRLHSSLYRDACTRLGVEFLPVPRAMQDAQGMLVAPAWRDATHANTLYGQHVLAQLAP